MSDWKCCALTFHTLSTRNIGALSSWTTLIIIMLCICHSSAHSEWENRNLWFHCPMSQFCKILISFWIQITFPLHEAPQAILVTVSGNTSYSEPLYLRSHLLWWEVLKSKVETSNSDCQSIGQAPGDGLLGATIQEAPGPCWLRGLSPINSWMHRSLPYLMVFSKLSPSKMGLQKGPAQKQNSSLCPTLFSQPGQLLLIFRSCIWAARQIQCG